MNKRILASALLIALGFGFAFSIADEVLSATSESSADNSASQSEAIERLKAQLSVAEVRLETANRIRRENSETIAELRATVSNLTGRLVVSQKMLSMLSKEQLMSILDESQKQIAELQAKDDEAVQTRLVFDGFREEMRQGTLVRVKNVKSDDSATSDIESEKESRGWQSDDSATSDNESEKESRGWR